MGVGAEKTTAAFRRCVDPDFGYQQRYPNHNSRWPDAGRFCVWAGGTGHLERSFLYSNKSNPDLGDLRMYWPSLPAEFEFTTLQLQMTARKPA